MERIKDSIAEIFKGLQNSICNALLTEESNIYFHEDAWQREGGGGGRSRVLQRGKVFEKAGVNFSEVYGLVTDTMKQQLQLDGHSFFATGVSLVIHPLNPFVPTTHANFRYFEIYNKQHEVIDCWFGGGADLTPYYLIEEDAIHFHNTFKTTCDQFDTSFYPLFKKQCDDYFVNKHRNNERRGIGGIFYDHERPRAGKEINFWMQFSQSCGNSFIQAYMPVVRKRKDTPFTSEHKYWQEIRRGRYTEFNLVHDRGTLFGLKTNGRTESILMSLPPTVRFDYNDQPAIDSEEQKLLEVCLHPMDWV